MSFEYAFEYQWPCPHCAWRSQAFVSNTRAEQDAIRALQKHIKEQHNTCQHCGAVGKGKAHEEACLRQRARKRAQKAKYIARQAMLLICLAGKADKADQDTNPTPIATLTTDVLQCVFKYM
jgi:hypothetical protein